MTMAASKAWISSQGVCLRCAGRISQRRNYFATDSLHSADESKLPRVANPSFWSSLIPRPFRRTSDPEAAAERARRREAGSGERRVGIIFMILGILVGSNAIQIISIKRQMLDYSRKTDAKLELLREVVQRVKNGEDIDVKKILGTGDAEQEREWEEVMKELENYDASWHRDDRKSSKRGKRIDDEEPKHETKGRSTSVQSNDTQTGEANSPTGPRPKFLM